MRIVFTDEEWHTVFERLKEARLEVEKDFQGKDGYDLYEEMAKRLHISTEELKKLWRGVSFNSYETEDEETEEKKEN